jgi:hypothetical protein
MLGVALAASSRGRSFSEGATALENEAGLQIALCTAALVTLAGLLFSPRVRLRAPATALVGLGMLALCSRAGPAGASRGRSRPT